MKIVCDAQEGDVMLECVRAEVRAQKSALEVEQRQLRPAGDFVLYETASDEWHYVLERKTFSDLRKSVTDGRWGSQYNEMLALRERATNDVKLGIVVEHGKGPAAAVAHSRIPVRKLYSEACARAREHGFTVLITYDHAQTAREVVKLFTHVCALLSRTRKRRRACIEEDDSGAEKAPALQRAIKRPRLVAKAGQMPSHRQLFAAMLTVMHRVTDDMAHAITRRYSTPQALVEACRRDGRKAFDDVRYASGARNDAAIGPVMRGRLVDFWARAVGTEDDATTEADESDDDSDEKSLFASPIEISSSDSEKEC